MAQINLTRDNIQTIINAAHVRLDEMSNEAADRYFRGQEEIDIAQDGWEAINIIKVLEDDTNLSDDDVEVLLDRLIKLTKALDVGFEGTTLQIVKNQPALEVTNILGSISGPAFTLPQYTIDGNDFEPSAILMSGGSSIFHQGSVYEIGYNVSTSDARIIRAGGANSNVDLTISSKGTGQLLLTGGNILANVNTQVTGNFSLAIGGTVNSISDDISTTGSSNELASSLSIRNYVTAVDLAARAYTDSNIVDANSGLTKTGTLIQMGGGLVQDTDIAMGASQQFKISSTGDTEEFIIQPAVGFTLKALGGSLIGTQTNLQVDGLINYVTDQNSNYTSLSLVDKNYSDNRIGGNLVASNVVTPSAGEDDFSITWDNSLQRYILKTKGTAGGIADATTLNGFTAAEFLKVNEADAKLQIQNYDLSALAGAAGREFLNFTVSADNTGNGARILLANTSNLDFFDTTNAQRATLSARSIDLNVTGVAPMTVGSNILVANLNADLLDGYEASIANVINTVVVRSAAGDIAATSLNGTPISTIVNSGGVVEATPNSVAQRSPSGVLYATQFNVADSGATANNIAFEKSGSSAEIRANNVSTFFNQQNGRTSLSASTAGLQIGEDLWVNGAIRAISQDVLAFASDERLKKNIKSLSTRDSLMKVMSLNPVTFNWIESGDHSKGFIAQEVQPYIPEAVDETEDDGMFLSLAPIVAELTGAIQELKGEIEMLKAEVAFLKGQNRY